MDENTFVNNLEDSLNTTETANGAKTLKSTKSDLLDFYAMGAACRSSLKGNWESVEHLFGRAFSEDNTLALRCLLHFRDIRGGQGERDVVRRLLTFLANNHKEAVLKNIKHIPHFGRWDDLFCLIGTPCEQAVLEFISKQLNADLSSSGEVSLLGKWMPSNNTSSKKTVQLANFLSNRLGYSAKEYRKMLVGLRTRINIVEKNMCAGKWDAINYERVPSRASMIYRTAFHKHDGERYTEYLEKVEKGEAEIKAGTLYPYDIIKAIRYSDEQQARSLELQWKALPDYLKDNPHNGLVIADVSGSMNGNPLDVCTSLAIYFAERNQGAFKDAFITFSNRPSLQKLKGKTLKEKDANLRRADWNQNTNLQAVFDVVLSTAVENNVPLHQMPNVLYIISDMQFDVACRDNDKTNFEVIKQKYEQSGYEMPKLVFWNVNATPEKGVPVKKDERGTYLVSGCSPVILKYLLGGISVTPYESMLEVLNNERYAEISA